jgi:hypothetical protein
LTHIRTVGNSTRYHNLVHVHDFKVATAPLNGNEEFDKTSFRHCHSSDEFTIFKNHRKVDHCQLPTLGKGLPYQMQIFRGGEQVAT